MDALTTSPCHSRNVLIRLFVTVMFSLIMLPCIGCYAPIHSPGVAARDLPDHFRWPTRTAANYLNYAHLVRRTPTVYQLGTGDKLALTAPDLIQQGSSESIAVEVLESGEISIPRLGAVHVAGLSLAEAQARVNEALSQGLLQNPQTVLTLTEKGTVNVLVLGAVQNPGVHALPRFENDVAHALAAAQGFSEAAGNEIEIHRRSAFDFAELATGNTVSLQGGPPVHAQPSQPAAPAFGHEFLQMSSSVIEQSHQIPTVATNGPHGFQDLQPGCTGEWCEGCVTGTSPIVRIPLRGDNQCINPDEVVLNSGDVIVIPQKKDKVFYVVGPLSEQNRLRFSVGDRDRQIGNGLLLPDDREVDVVTAVAMAGFIDPIDSPTTVTVHRAIPGKRPLLVRVDLIAARIDTKETIMVEAGDIIYLNPDPWWYGRRLFDRVVERALGTAIGRLVSD